MTQREQRGSGFRPRTFVIELVAVFLVSTLSGCGRGSQVIQIDPRFSYNVVKAPPWFPGDEEALSPAQREYLLREGPPDFIRFWWFTDGRPITSSDLSGKVETMEDLMIDTKRTWIYRSEAKEVEFHESGSVEEHPLSTKFKLICDYGDPSKKHEPRVLKSGAVRETWLWMDRGRIVTLIDGEVAETDYFPGTGSGTILTK